MINDGDDVLMMMMVIFTAEIFYPKTICGKYMGLVQTSAASQLLEFLKIYKIQETKIVTKRTS